MPAMYNQSELSLQQLQNMLHTILNATDNNERRSVETVVVRALSSPSTLVLLMTVLQDMQAVSAGVRQLAAVLLRKKIFSLWRSIPPESRSRLKSMLLELLGVEPMRVVRLAIAHLVSRVAKANALDDDEGWPELFHAIHNASSDPRAEVRELAMILAYSIAEVVSDGSSSLSIVEAVVQGMLDKEESVQRAAVRAVGALLVPIQTRKDGLEQLLQRLICHCMTLLTHCGTSVEKTDLCVDVLDVLEQLMEILTVKKHEAVLRGVGMEVLSLFSNRKVLPRVRQNCSDLLVALVNQKSKFVSSTLLEPTIAACVRVMGEDETISLPEVAHVPGADGDDETSEVGADMLHVNPPCMYAGRLLSTMATKVPARAFTNALLPHVTCITENPEAGPLERKAAVVALACLAEGNPVYLRRRVKYVLDLIHEFLHDVHPVPREAAAFALTYFCLHLQPEILTHHEKLFPLLVPLLSDSVDAVRCRVAGALDALCENVAGDVEPYVPLLLPAVLEAIASSSLQTQCELCSVISSLATTRCAAFQQYAVQCLELLKSPLTMMSPDTILLRARATETAGIVAAAIGKEVFIPHLPFFIEHVANNLQTRQAQLREESFGFLSNLCELLRDDFLPYLNDSINYALQTISEDRMRYENRHLLAAGGMHSFMVKEDCAKDKYSRDDMYSSNDSCDDSEAEEIHAHVCTADMEEKSSAVYFVGVCAEVLLLKLGSHHIETCWSVLEDLNQHFHTNVRCSVLVALAKLAQAAHGSKVLVRDLTHDALAPHARQLLSSLVNDTLLLCMYKEENKEVVASACDAFEVLFNFFGTQVFLGDVDEFIETVKTALQQRLPSQQEDEDDSEDDDQGITTDDGAVTLGEDHDGVLMDAVCDMVEAFAKAYGPAFKPYSDIILPLLLPYTAEDRPPEDIVMATGCIGTVLEALGAEAAPFVEHAISLVMRLVSVTDESSARANCAYIVRVVVESCPTHFDSAAAARPLLEMLWSIANSGDEIPAAVDNAVSATCSMIRYLSPEAVPLAFVVPAVLGRIPMRVDRGENGNAIRTLVYLLSNQREFVVTQCWVQTVQCVATVLASFTVEEEHKKMLVAQGVVPLLQQCGEQWRNACMQLPAELRVAVEGLGSC
ncbi:Importin beta N terminal domain [Trypanosoma vivax]|nr:Importin beta N terminal domain [Trypanosoma vivax]